MLIVVILAVTNRYAGKHYKMYIIPTYFYSQFPLPRSIIHILAPLEISNRIWEFFKSLYHLLVTIITKIKYKI